MIKRERVLLLLVITFLGICSLGTTSILYAYQNAQLKQRNANLEQMTEDFLGAYFELYTNHWEYVINHENYTQQMYDDVELFIEFMFDDYEQTQDWDLSLLNFQLQFPKVYERLLVYDTNH